MLKLRHIQFLQPGDAGRLHLLEIDAGAKGYEARPFAIGDKALGVIIVEDGTQLGERPTQSGARIVRQFPQHFA